MDGGGGEVGRVGDRRRRGKCVGSSMSRRVQTCPQLQSAQGWLMLLWPQCRGQDEIRLDQDHHDALALS
jgi:hypothetical protein